MARPGLDGVFADWKEREALAEAMIAMIGGLYRRNVVIYIHGLPLNNQSVIDLMKSHRFVRQIEQNEMSEFENWSLFPPQLAFADTKVILSGVITDEIYELVRQSDIEDMEFMIEDHMEHYKMSRVEAIALFRRINLASAEFDIDEEEVAH